MRIRSSANFWSWLMSSKKGSIFTVLGIKWLYKFAICILIHQIVNFPRIVNGHLNQPAYGGKTRITRLLLSGSGEPSKSRWRYYRFLKWQWSHVSSVVGRWWTCSPPSKQAEFTRPGVCASSVLISVTSPVSGEYSSLAAFTLSSAPNSSMRQRGLC